VERRDCRETPKKAEEVKLQISFQRQLEVCTNIICYAPSTSFNKKYRGMRSRE
jgi:hypothetical protein